MWSDDIGRPNHRQSIAVCRRGRLLAEHLQTAVRLAGDLLSGRVVERDEWALLINSRSVRLGEHRHRGDEYVVATSSVERRCQPLDLAGDVGADVDCGVEGTTGE